MTSFAEIYEAHARDVFRFALYLSGNRSEAEDLTAEAFVRLWTARNVRLATVKAYLLAITRNLHLEQLRVRRVSEELSDFVEDRSPSPEAVAVGRDRVTKLLAILQTMPEVDRSALLMRADGLSYEEIAEALGITLSNTKVKIHRARVKAAVLLKKKGD
jgi:RNA polymerase sigma-70 factor, ECF subfamily